MSYDSHTNNVMAVGFQCDGKWMYSGSEDGTVKIWDLRPVKIFVIRIMKISVFKNGSICYLFISNGLNTFFS